MNNEIYMLFYDRGNRAQDNGEYLCRWVMKNHPEIKTGYILNKNSHDWERLEIEGFNLINNLDRKVVQSEIAKCDYICSSIFNEGMNFNFNGCKCKRIFLNHGCFLVPINYIRDECNNIDLFITASKIEYDTLLNPYHKLTEDQVALCGQPRQDSLVKLQKQPHEENCILIQFWHRPWEWSKNKDEKFLNSDFYKKTTEILKNKKLLNLCKCNNLKIIFKMHPLQYGWLKYYKRYESDLVEISDLKKAFEPEFIRSKFIITDISSNAYEMAKINKPCIYFEPDPDELFKWRRSRNGEFEFDLDKNSIGPVVYKSVDKLIDEIEKLIKNNCCLDKEYNNRRSNQLCFLKDENNCKRCFEAILKVTKSRSSYKVDKNKNLQKSKENIVKESELFTGLTEEWWKEEY